MRKVWTRARGSSGNYNPPSIELYYVFFIADSLGFRKVLCPDGTDLELIFKKLKYPRSNDVTPMHFVGWLSDNHRVTIWELDPGSTDLFVAADGSNQNAHWIRRTSTKEYYDLCGFKVANENRRIWRTEADLHQLSIIDGIPTIKTTDLEQLHRSITYRLQHSHSLRATTTWIFDLMYKSWKATKADNEAYRK
jgi:hypothetical protein